jgi:pyruvate-formate lyase-activating enzyme
MGGSSGAPHAGDGFTIDVKATKSKKYHTHTHTHKRKMKVAIRVLLWKSGAFIEVARIIDAAQPT